MAKKIENIIYLQNGKTITMQEWIHEYVARYQTNIWSGRNTSVSCLAVYKKDTYPWEVKHTLADGSYIRIYASDGSNRLTYQWCKSDGTVLYQDGIRIVSTINTAYFIETSYDTQTFRVYQLIPKNDEYPTAKIPTDNNPVLWDFVDLFGITEQRTWWPNYNDWMRTAPQFAIPWNRINTDDIIKKPDPYKPGGSSTPTGGMPGEGVGGGGDFDTTSDPIAIPDLPSVVNAAETGFLSIYAPTLVQVKNLAGYMWTTNFVESIIKLYQDPMQAIISFGAIPFSPETVLDTSIKVLGVSIPNVSLNKCLSQYMTFDCGTINLHEYFGSCFDYSPFTSLELYCPFTGYHQIDVDSVMGLDVNLFYNIDICTGNFVAFLSANEAVLYQWAGNCRTEIPISANNWGDFYIAMVQGATNIASAMATGGASVVVSTVGTSMSNMSNSKPSISHGGGFGGSNALLSVKTPYFVINRPRQVLPEKQDSLIGYPASYSIIMSELEGYTVIKEVHLDNIPCTDAELNQIETLLKGGVIFGH